MLIDEFLMIFLSVVVHCKTNPDCDRKRIFLVTR